MSSLLFKKASALLRSTTFLCSGNNFRDASNTSATGASPRSFILTSLVNMAGKSLSIANANILAAWLVDFLPDLVKCDTHSIA